MDDKLKNYAIGTLTLALLISLGFNVAPDDNYICRSTELVMHCNRLSSTGNTCYPYPTTTVGKKFCGDGWEEILKKPELVPIGSSSDFNIGTVWNCIHEGCKRIK